jgi:hypothetical protein
MKQVIFHPGQNGRIEAASRLEQGGKSTHGV